MTLGKKTIRGLIHTDGFWFIFELKLEVKESPAPGSFILDVRNTQTERISSIRLGLTRSLIQS